MCIRDRSHRKVGRWTAVYGIEEVICYGKEARFIYEEAKKAGVSAYGKTPPELALLFAVHLVKDQESFQGQERFDDVDKLDVYKRQVYREYQNRGHIYTSG